MRRLLLSSFLTFNFSFLIFNWAFAQSPQSFSFQAVVRDGSGDLVTSSQVGMRISLLQGSASGTVVYAETHTPITNANGLASVQVGGGSVVSGTFASIDWATGPYYIKSETDPSGGTAYSIVGTQQLNSVPYALYAANAGDGGLPDGSAVGNTPYWNGTEWVTNSSNIYNNGGNVGIGITTPTGKFEVGTPAIGGTPVLDQQCLENGNSFTGSTNMWQSFTAGMSGQLTKVAVEKWHSGPTNGFTLNIYLGEGTAGALMHTQSVSVPYILTGTMAELTLTTGPIITQGQQYTWQLTNGTSFGLIGYYWATYTGGTGNHGADQDYRFATYVLPAANLGDKGIMVSSGYNVGIGTTSPTAKLDVSGTLRINDGTQGNGKILTSGADGTASWQTAASFVGATGPTGPAGNTGATGPTGPTGLLANGSGSGATPYWNGTNWVTSSTNLSNDGFYVTIGNGSYPNNEILDVKGVIKANKIRLTAGAGTDYVLKGNANGEASWAAPSSLGIGNIYNGDGEISGQRTLTMTNTNGITFQSNAGHFIFNTTSGNMGVGRTAPKGRLHINYQASTSGGLMNGLILQNSLSAIDNASDINFVCYPDESGVTSANARIRAVSNTNHGASIIFSTKTTGAFGNSLVERMRISDSGNVGIGTGSTTPSSKLHVLLPTGNNGNPTSNGILVYNSGVGGDDDDAIITAQVSNASSGDPFFALGVASDGGWSMGLDNSDEDKFKISSSWSDPSTDTRLTIKKTDGNVGIGNTSPAHKLSVTGTGRFTDMLSVEAEGRFETANGIIRITPTGWRVAERAQLKVYSKGEYPAELDLGQAAGGQELGWHFSARSSSEDRKLRIYRRSNDDFFQTVSILHTNGNMGIGVDDPAEKLEVDGKVKAKGYICRSGESGSYGNNVFNFFWTGAQLQTWIDGINLGVTSDRRLKDRINPLTNNAIERVMALRPVDFYFKKVEGTIFTGSDVQQEGFIADELQAVIPSAVTGEKDALTKDGTIQPQTVNVTPIISVLTKAVQEQQAMIASQQTTINALLERIDALEQHTK